jgi:hypothetical protein
LLLAYRPADDEEAINAHFDAVDARLTMYEKIGE